MKLQQLRYLVGIAREGFSVSRAASLLGTSQPANQQADPDAGDRARRRSPDPPQQPHPRADRGRRGHHRGRAAHALGGGQSPAHHRGVHAKGRRPAGDRHHPHVRALCAAAGHQGLHAEPSAGAARPAAGHPVDDRAMGGVRRGRRRHQREVARRARRAGVPALCRASPQHLCAQAPSAAAREDDCRSARSPGFRSSRSTSAWKAGARSWKRSRPRASSPTSC